MEYFTKEEMKQLRLDLKLSQPEFGRVLGISTSLIAALELGGRPMTFRTQTKINRLVDHIENVIGDEWGTYKRCKLQIDEVVENGLPTNR